MPLESGVKGPAFDIGAKRSFCIKGQGCLVTKPAYCPYTDIIPCTASFYIIIDTVPHTVRQRHILSTSSFMQRIRFEIDLTVGIFLPQPKPETAYQTVGSIYLAAVSVFRTVVRTAKFGVLQLNLRFKEAAVFQVKRMPVFGTYSSHMIIIFPGKMPSVIPIGFEIVVQFAAAGHQIHIGTGIIQANRII